MTGLSAAWVFAPFVAVALVGWMANVMRRERAVYMQRDARLSEVASLLRSHDEALREFCSFDVPDSLKAMLLVFGDEISTEKRAWAFMERAFNKPHNTEISDLQPLKDLVALRDNWPGKAQVFDRAITTGVIAAIYRWPHAAKPFADYMQSLAVDREKGVAAVVEVAATTGECVAAADLAHA